MTLEIINIETYQLELLENFGQDTKKQAFKNRNFHHQSHNTDNLHAQFYTRGPPRFEI